MTHHVEIREEPLARLPVYGRVPIAFEVRSILECRTVDGGLGGFALSERRLDEPYAKDYDALRGEGPAHWMRRFDLSRWGLLMAWLGDDPVGGAAVAFDTPGVEMLEGRRDLAVLWDLRVAPEVRGQGVGSALFAAAAAWAAGRGCTRLKIETQNVNVLACRFYAGRGCVLGAIHRYAYPELPEEIQLLWYLDLRRLDASETKAAAGA